MAHPQHAIPLVLPDGEVRAVVRAPCDRANELGAVRFFEHDLLDERRHTVLHGVARQRSRRVEHDGRGGKRHRVGARRGVDSVSRRALGRPAAAQAVGGRLHSSLMRRLRDDRRVRSASVAAHRRGRRRAGDPFRQDGTRAVPALFWVLAAFVLANFAYQAAQPFYNAMMPELVPVEERGRLSGFGTAIGYVGSIVGVLLVMPFFNGTLAGASDAQRRRDGRASLDRAVHLARRPRVGVRADGRAVSAFLAAAVHLLPRPQSGAARDADRLAPRGARRRPHDSRRAPASGRAALHHRVVRLSGRDRNDRWLHDAVRREGRRASTRDPRSRCFSC